MAVWPVSLPNFRNGLTDQRRVAKIRTAMDAGPVKSRARFVGDAERSLAVPAMYLTQTQRETLDTFHNTTLGEGADSFTHIDPVDGTGATLRFISPPSYLAVVPGGPGNGVALWSATLALEII